MIDYHGEFKISHFELVVFAAPRQPVSSIQVFKRNHMRIEIFVCLHFLFFLWGAPPQKLRNQKIRSSLSRGGRTTEADNVVEIRRIEVVAAVRYAQDVIVEVPTAPAQHLVSP